MSRTRRASLGRTGLLGLLGALILLISGDRGAFTAPGPDIGIDPLEILNLQIRANAIVVLDSSGSMAETLAAGDTGGDDPTSKLWLAKDVMRTFVAANERKVSFMFGQYEQPGIGTQPATVMSLPTTGIGRFLYTTTSENGPAPVPVRAPSMLTNELRVDLRAPYAFTVAQSLLLRENGATTSTTCPLPAGQAHLALAVEQALSNCVAAGNAYTVSINDANQYTITRTTGTFNWLIRWADMTTAGTTQLRTALGTAGSANMAATTTATFTAPADPPVTGTSPVLWLRRASNSDFVESGVTHYMMYASRFFNGQTIPVRPDGIPCAVPTPAVGTLNVGGDGSSLSFDTAPWVDLVAFDATCAAALTPAQTVRFAFSSVPRSGNFAGTTDDGEWRTWAGNTTCGGFEGLLPLQACTVQAQLGLFTPFLRNEVPINAGTRWPVGYSEDATGNVTAQPTVGGMRAGGNTPIAETITDVKDVFLNGRPTATPPLPAMWPAIAAYGGGNGPFPKTFLIFLTDGDDTCESENGDACSGSACLTDDQKALRAAYRAQLLRQSIDTTTPPKAAASSITTYVIAFGSGASASRSDWIAYGGSGMIGGPGPGQIPLATNPTVGAYWSRGPNAAEIAACTTCRPASVATNAAALATALQAAIDQGQTFGVYSDQQSVTESIFELSYLANAALSPFEKNRYDFSVPILLQSTFEMPSFEGRLRAFRRSGSVSVMDWDAGQQLQNRVSSQVGSVNRTFLELRGSSGTNDSNVLNSDALIERRIYTTSRNGVFGATIDNLIDASLTATPPNRLTLWPTQPSVDPAQSGSTYPAGVLDLALGITTGSTPPMTFANLQTTFGACTASTTGGALPADCTSASGRGVKEARQIILAHMAGAEVVKVGTNAVRNATGQLLYRMRTWILAESTLAAPAAVGPPADERTKFHVTEYLNFVKGPGGAALSMGFGLTAPPDLTSPTVVDPEHQPVMSVVYHAANDMLHAFRAGPCNKGLGCYGSTPAETGGEELWGFVPFDLLGSLKERLKPQGRTNHAYMLSTPVRLADVFVPGAFSRSVESTTIASNDGAWRVMIYFGRGIGGKYLTALDVTAPAQFNRHSLRTTGPIPIWSRGNPDTQNGLASGTLNNTLNPADATAYRQMGQTWSIPAIGFVERAGNTTTRTPAGVEYVAYAGSGYGDNSGCPSDPCEGARFYSLDALTGDVIASFNVGNRNGSATPFPNVIAAGPSVFQADRVSYRPQGGINESSKEATAVYFNDIHGRVWKIDTTAPGTAIMLGDVNDTGPTQHPLAVSPALLNYTDPITQGGDGMEHAHIYVESGNDNRIFLPTDAVPTTPPFKAWGLLDRNPGVEEPSDGVIGPVKVLFTKNFPALYRGTTQAATSFNATGLGRVFIAGTRFNPPGTVNAPPPPPCRSSFDSILFALGAATGNAAFDLNGGTDEYVEYRDQKIMSVQAVRGHVVVDLGLGASIQPDAPPPVLISQPVPGSVFNGTSVGEQYAIVNRETPFRAQPTLCR